MKRKPMNMVQKLGVDYFNQMYRGSYFKRGNTLCQVERATRTTVMSSVWTPEGDAGPGSVLISLRHGIEHIPNAEFTDMEVFAAPAMGYRSIGNRALARIIRARTVHRGISPSNLRVTRCGYFSDVVGAMGVSVSSILAGERLMYRVFFPHHTGYNEGIRSILEGDALCFTLSSNWAVGVHRDGIAIQFKGKTIGSVTETGEVHMTVPSLSKAFDKVVTNNVA